MLSLLQFCVSGANIRKIIFVYQSQRTVAYFMQMMRPVTDLYCVSSWPYSGTCFLCTSKNTL